jgi:hypothetical protein
MVPDSFAEVTQDGGNCMAMRGAALKPASDLKLPGPPANPKIFFCHRQTTNWTQNGGNCLSRIPIALQAAPGIGIPHMPDMPLAHQLLRILGGICLSGGRIRKEGNIVVRLTETLYAMMCRTREVPEAKAGKEVEWKFLRGSRPGKWESLILEHSYLKARGEGKGGNAKV